MKCVRFKSISRLFPRKQILQMVTVNPARALHQENALGRIRQGFQADLVAVPSSGSTDVFEQIIAFDASVELGDGERKRDRICSGERRLLACRGRQLADHTKPRAQQSAAACSRSFSAGRRTVQVGRRCRPELLACGCRHP